MTSFWQLIDRARRAQLSDGSVSLDWTDALKIAERGERLEIENEQLKRDLATCSKVIDREQLKRLKASPEVASPQ